MSARDELVQIICEGRAAWVTDLAQRKSEEYQADAILAAGYSKPRTITTIDELDALPDRSLIETRGGVVFQKYAGWFAKGENGWHRPGYEWTERTRNFDDEVHQPLTVIHTPKES